MQAKTNQQIAIEVIAGKWGNGQERRKKLTSAGYSYESVQSIVNALMSGKNVEAPDNPVAQTFSITGTQVMKIEIDLSEYKGIELTFVNKVQEKSTIDESLMEGWE